MNSRVKQAFDTAREIEALMQDLLHEIDKIAQDETLSPQARHLCIDQICAMWKLPATELSKAAQRFLEDCVPQERNVIVEGFEIDNHYIAGKVYDCAPKVKVELLNKDDNSWNRLVTSLAQNNMSKIIQKRLTPSYFSGNQSEVVLSACLGLVGLIEEPTWNIKAAKKS